jgi:hypothetical protein
VGVKTQIKVGRYGKEVGADLVVNPVLLKLDQKHFVFAVAKVKQLHPKGRGRKKLTLRTKLDPNALV